ncbi:MAG: hypothetical protein OT477_18725 [Chloroflexi bacterium]|nr:hypothetical protein [Chloroflexota bacterium]
MKYAELKHRQYTILGLTTLTNEEFEWLVLPFDKAFIDHMVMEIACALHNFRLRFSPWQPVELMP